MLLSSLLVSLLAGWATTLAFPTQSRPSVVHGLRGKELYGYWEDWCNENEDVTWWKDDTPGNCAGGCVLPTAFFKKAASFNTLTYSFSTLLRRPQNDQNDCSTGCPVWDGFAIYREKDASITTSSTVEHPSPTVVSISEFCRLARQFPTGPKRCLIGLGGWSDWVRLGNVTNAQKLAQLAAKLVLHTFADGIDLDFEHLSEIKRVYGEAEIHSFHALANGIRAQLDNITPIVWNETVSKRITALQAGPSNEYTKANLAYLAEVAANGPPRFEMVYTTRFNAFRNPDRPFDWEVHETNVSYVTDDEGLEIWPYTSKAFDTVNVMSYDQDKGLMLNFTNILTNFHVHGGVPKEKLNIGFEPGEQGGGGRWEGQTADLTAIDFVSSGTWGGAMIWGVNPDKHDQPHAYQLESSFVDAVASRLRPPAWPWDSPPGYNPLLQ